MKGDLANWLTKELRERGWTVSYVAKIGNLSISMVNCILSERREPGLKTYQVLSTVFNVPLLKLLQLAGIDVYGRGANCLANEVMAMVPLLDEEQLTHARFILNSMLKAKSIERSALVTTVLPEKGNNQGEIW